MLALCQAAMVLAWYEAAGKMLLKPPPDKMALHGATSNIPGVKFGVSGMAVAPTAVTSVVCQPYR